MVNVVVIGGGVVGVSTAFSLAERGVAVELLERGEVCSGASWGNAGWVFPSHSLPIPGPGVIGQGLRWMLDPEGPLYIRPRASVSLVRWLWRFARACNADAMERGFGLRRELSLASLERYRELASRPGLEFAWQARGIAMACRTPEALEHVHVEARLLEQLGGRCEALDANGLREWLPALAPDLAGGVRFPDDAHIVPGAFVQGLAREAEKLGAVVRTHTEVLAIEPSAGGVRIRTTRGDVEADEAVLAAGAWSPALARALELRLPVESAKGYSISVRRPDDFPESPVLLTEARVAVTPMADALRFAGTLELGGLNLGVDLRRVEALRRAVRDYLPGLADTEVLEVWRGLRPLTPDDLPIIGRPRACPRVLLATGHGMTGLAQGPITGEIAARLLCGEEPGLDLTPFSPDRF